MTGQNALQAARRPGFSLPGRLVWFVLIAIARTAPSLGPGLQRGFIRSWYALVSALLPKAGDDMTFLNYGYAALDEANGLALRAEDSADRHPIQLYHRVVGGRDLHGKDVLEVGCGRGGGSSYIARYLGPRAVTGVDLAATAVKFCRRRHRLDGLVFLEGNAEDLPFPAASFDVVVNVESSHCYPSFDRFLQEVSRVLRPGGEFLFADLRSRDEVTKLREQLNLVFTVVEEERITANVFRALELDSDRRKEMIHRKAPRVLRRAFNNFAAVEGSPVFDALRRRDLEYVRFVCELSTGAS